MTRKVLLSRSFLRFWRVLGEQHTLRYYLTRSTLSLIKRTFSPQNKFFKIERSGNCPDTALDAPIYFGNLSASFGKAGLKFIGSIPVKELIKDDIDVRHDFIGTLGL